MVALNEKSVKSRKAARESTRVAVYRPGLRADQLDEVILGNVCMPADATNPAGVAALWAGVPDEVPAFTVQRNCASGMEAVAEAAQRIRAKTSEGASDSPVILAGGAESMSTIPLLFPQSTLGPMAKMARAKTLFQRLGAIGSLRPRHFKPIAGLEVGLTDPTNEMIMGKTAELIASEFGISRKEQDEFALRSHQKAAAARAAGRFKEEIVPVYVPGREGFEAVSEDVGPRANQTLEALAKLKPIFDRKDGTVTVGNACQVTDGDGSILAIEDGFELGECLQS